MSRAARKVSVDPPTYHAAVALTCPHGLPPNQCLICPTLPQAATPAPTPEPRSGPNLVLVIGAVVVVGLLAWAAVGLVLSALHILELLALAAAAGWLGYRIGVYRGRRAGTGER